MIYVCVSMSRINDKISGIRLRLLNLFPSAVREDLSKCDMCSAGLLFPRVSSCSCSCNELWISFYRCKVLVTARQLQSTHHYTEWVLTLTWGSQSSFLTLLYLCLCQPIYLFPKNHEERCALCPQVWDRWNGTSQVLKSGSYILSCKCLQIIEEDDKEFTCLFVWL